MKRSLFLTLAVLLVTAVPAVAQVDPTMPRYDLFRFQVYRTLDGVPGANPITNTDIPRTQLQCGRTITPNPGTVSNPTGFSVEDPDTVAPNLRQCEWTDPGTGPLFSLPFDPVFSYIARGAWHNTTGYGANVDSANSFNRPGRLPDAARTIILRRPTGQ